MGRLYKGIYKEGALGEPGGGGWSWPGGEEEES
jgi:hypothetical protein